ncbi:MAG: DUF924 family protein [Pseudomonadota bacterium]
MDSAQQDILNFWFEETEPAQWFQTNPDFDQAIIDRFEALYERAALGEFDQWQESAGGVLALCILLDQMPRNMFRNTPQAFATDSKALEFVKVAIPKGLDRSLPVLKRRFLYLPYEHSEDLEDQKSCVALFETIKDEDKLGYDYAIRHYEVIEQFGRFPHRNIILGRENTKEEEIYLSRPDAGF